MREYIRLTGDYFEKWKVVELYLGDSVRPKILGKYNPREKIFETKKTDRHILEMANGFGFNYKFISEYPIDDIIVKYKNKKMTVRKDELIKNGNVEQFENLDKQIFLSINKFKIQKSKKMPIKQYHLSHIH